MISWVGASVTGGTRKHSTPPRYRYTFKRDDRVTALSLLVVVGDPDRPKTAQDVDGGDRGEKAYRQREEQSAGPPAGRQPS